MHAPAFQSAIDAYAALYPNEQATIARFLALPARGAAIFHRDYIDPGHVTGSAWVLAPAEAGSDRGPGGPDAVALLHHRKLDIWVQPGGHADGDPDVLAVARREALEETGLAELAHIETGDTTAAVPVPFDLDVHAIPARGGEPAHWHFDVRYAFRALSGRLAGNDESRAVAWVSLDALTRYTEETSVLRMAEKWRCLNRGRAMRWTS